MFLAARRARAETVQRSHQPSDSRCRNNPVILITGGTGKQGGAVARELLAAGHRLDDVTSLPDALDGVWGAFAVQNTWEAGVEREEAQGTRFAETARKAGVQHYGYASVGSAHRETGIPHFENKARVEDRVRELGFPSWSVLRPAFFMENFLSGDNRAAIANGQLTLGIQPDTRLQMIAVEDIGKYGKLVFEQPERFNGRSIDISGNEITMREVAEGLSQITKRPVAPAPTPIEQTREWSQDLATMLEWFDEVGYNADIAANEKEFGIWPQTAVWGQTPIGGLGPDPDERHACLARASRDMLDRPSRIQLCHRG